VSRRAGVRFIVARTQVVQLAQIARSRNGIVATAALLAPVI
jgi:hypothetical protein